VKFDGISAERPDEEETSGAEWGRTQNVPQFWRMLGHAGDLLSNEQGPRRTQGSMI